jgi:spore maturation protein SpmA
MIQLEYDVATSGVRVTASFLVLDECASPVGTHSFEQLDDMNEAPSTLNNLEHVRSLLDFTIERLKKRDGK